MLPKKYTIAMVNYLNARPFLYGLQHDEDHKNLFEVLLLNPAKCAEAFQNQLADIALIPAGVLMHIQHYKKITSYGIAADDEVRTVCLFSNDPPQEWQEVILDDHSRTSVLLAKLIIRDVLKIQPSFVTKKIENHNIEKGQAVLMIGDKVFLHENQFKVCLDLASYWKKWTGLPFVFAVWVAKPDVPDEVTAHLNPAFAFGLRQIDQVIAQSEENPALLSLYYKKYIQYVLTDDYEKGLKLYLEKAKTL